MLFRSRPPAPPPDRPLLACQLVTHDATPLSALNFSPLRNAPTMLWHVGHVAWARAVAGGRHHARNDDAQTRAIGSRCCPHSTCPTSPPKSRPHVTRHAPHATRHDPTSRVTPPPCHAPRMRPSHAPLRMRSSHVPRARDSLATTVMRGHQCHGCNMAVTWRSHTRHMRQDASSLP